MTLIDGVEKMTNKPRIDLNKELNIPLPYQVKTKKTGWQKTIIWILKVLIYWMLFWMLVDGYAQQPPGFHLFSLKTGLVFLISLLVLLNQIIFKGGGE